MLKGEKVTYLRHTDIQGESAKGKYHFAKLEISFGLESRNIPLHLDLLPQVKSLNYGDKLNLDIDIEERGNDVNIMINKINKVV
jgi:hypothetical protein